MSSIFVNFINEQKNLICNILRRGLIDFLNWSKGVTYPCILINDCSYIHCLLSDTFIRYSDSSMQVRWFPELSTIHVNHNFKNLIRKNDRYYEVNDLECVQGWRLNFEHENQTDSRQNSVMKRYFR